MSVLKTRPERAILEEIALLKSVNPAFVEKDWYVTQLIRIIADFHHDAFEMVFSGGTALSKAHKLIQRFSEDVDFRMVSSESTHNRKTLSAFKNKLLNSLRKAGFSISDHQVKARDENRFFSIDIDYDSCFPRVEALRPHVQIEVIVKKPQLPPMYLPVASFIAELTGLSPEVESIACINPIENTADKLSAISWRIPDRVRGDQYDDPAIVRHIHDLAILKDNALEYSEFAGMVSTCMDQDNRRSKNNPSFADLPLQEKFSSMLAILDSDTEYAIEYDRFVKGVSYAPGDSTPDFTTAVVAIKLLVKNVLSRKRAGVIKNKPLRPI